jgi:hypothetical protein
MLIWMETANAREIRWSPTGSPVGVPDVAAFPGEDDLQADLGYEND